MVDRCYKRGRRTERHRASVRQKSVSDMGRCGEGDSESTAPEEYMLHSQVVSASSIQRDNGTKACRLCQIPVSRSFMLV